MKLTFILLTAAMLNVSASGVSQTVTFYGTNVPLHVVLEEVKKQTGFSFFYDEALLNIAKPVTIDSRSEELRVFLTRVFTDQPLSFKITNKNIVIGPALAEHLGYSALLPPPPVTVRGRILNENNEPVIASVTIKGSNRGTTSDANGNFELIGVDENATLIITSANTETTTIKVDGNSTLRITVKSAVTDLNEIVINKGYYTEKQRLSTGSVAKVDSKTIERQPVNNPLLALQGRVPGLFIEQTSGIPGSKMNVSIRGKNSLQNGIDPLYIVDGVPFSSQSLSGVNSSTVYNGNGISPFYSIASMDIESIEVLKDADATAIYGSRGANGVILITTKRGKEGKAKLNLNVSTGTSKVPHFLDLLNTEEYLKVRHEGLSNDNVPIPESWDYSINGTWDTTRYTNWQKELLGGTAQNTIAQASISGGSQSTSYLFSGTFQKENSIFPIKNELKKGSFLFSVSNDSPNEKLKSRFSANYVVNSNDMNGGDLTGSALILPPNAPKLYNDDGTFNWENSTWTNPLAGLKNVRYVLKSYNLITNASLGYEILPRLVVKANIGLNHLQMDERTVALSTAFDPAYGLTPAYSQVFVTGGSNKTWILEPQVSWEGKDKSVGKLSLIIGGTFQNQTTDKESNRYMNFASNALVNNVGSAASVFNGDSSNSIYRYAAVFARANYSFMDKYILNLTGRRDGSSRFGLGRQFANLGALGVAWIFSNEDFTNNISFLSFGKLRSSFGSTGNDQIGDYRYLDTYSGYGTYNASSAIVPTRLFNPDYAWETTRKFEVAVDLGFLNDRISFSSAYYNNRSSNQLIDYRVGSTTGFNGILKNFPAKIQNSGLEFQLNTVNTINHFKWTTSLNVSFQRNKLIEFEGLDASSYASTYVVGKSLTISKRYNYTGIDENTGIYTFEDMNGDGQLTSADRLVVQELKTKFFGGINNSFSYKGLTLDIFFQFVNKNAPSVYQAFFFTPGGPFNQPKSVMDNGWTIDHTQSRFQRFSVINSDVYTSYDRYLGSTAGYVDASFIRLKNVSASYQLPKKLIKGIGATLFIHGQNILTITGYEGLDPETGPGYSVPTLRTIVVGANITL